MKTKDLIKLLLDMDLEKEVKIYVDHEYMELDIREVIRYKEIISIIGD